MRVRKAIAQAFVFVFILVAVTSIVSMSAKADSTWDDTLVVEDAKYWGIATRVQSDRYGVKIGDEYYKITKVEEYVKGVGIDVFAALRGKAGIIAVGETPIPDGTWKIAQTFSESDKSFKVIYTPTTDSIKELGGLPATKAIGGEYGYFVGLVGKGIVKEVDLFDDNYNYYIDIKHNDQWRAITGNAQSGAYNKYFNKENINNVLKMLTQNGSTLNFRMREGNWHWPTKEIKVKIPTQPKAPAVKFNLAKDTSNVKKGMEYTLLNEAALASFLKDGKATWKKIDSKSGLSISEVFSSIGNTNENIYLLARISATGKKIASKYATVEIIKKEPEFSFTAESGVTGASIKLKPKKADDNKDYGYVEVKPALSYDVTKGAAIINGTGLDIEYSIKRDNEEVAPKWVLLKAGTKASPGKSSVRYSEQPKSGTYDVDRHSIISFRTPGMMLDKGNKIKLPYSLGEVPVKFKNTEQRLSSATGGAVTVSAISVATGRAISHELKLKITNVSKMSTKPKLKVTSKLKGVSVAVSKVMPDKSSLDGYFSIIIKANKNTFKTEDSLANAVLQFDLKFESIEDSFEITFEKKQP